VLTQARFDPESVRKLFDAMASTYGHVNLLSSFGFTARWRHQAMRGLTLYSAGCVVDLMSGMGELWRSLGRELPNSAHVIGVDISPAMAQRARRKQRFSTEVVVADVLAWNPQPGLADVVVSSFGLKTFDREQQRQVARKVAQLLKPGCSYSFVEISMPSFRPLRAAFMFYLKRVIPLVGQALLGDPECYRMLGAYTEAFWQCYAFRRLLEKCWP
jgi:demethylmenaquinone methyltransferase/2-methoxy-6-polyprenyl-1,4-benzoquinol methylase